MKENYIWYEKHRCKTLDEMVLPKSTIKAFQKYIEDEEIPHLLLHGIQGSGKTSMAKIFINSLPCTSLTLNGSSNDRGVAVVKGKVKDFAASQTVGDKKIKIVFIDEANGMTIDAMEALKNTIEKYSSKCRFILTTNSLYKIDPAIRSRCTDFEFSEFGKDRLFDLCCDILDQENIDFEDEDVDYIIERLYPDIRSVVNNLQKCSISEKLDLNNLMSFNLSSSDIIDLIKKGELRKLRESWVGVGSFQFIYNILFNKFIESLSDTNKPLIALIVAKYLFQDTTIADNEINLTACLVEIMMELEIDIIW